MNRRINVFPKLRFPEYENDETWTMNPLFLLADKVTLKNKNGTIQNILTNSAIEGIIEQKDYFDRKIVEKDNSTNYFVVNVGDYVYNPRISSNAPVGPISKNKLKQGIVSPLYTVFRFKNENNDFYEQYFKSFFWHRYIKKISNTGARHDRISISDEIFFNMPLPYKEGKEPQKIADCLSSLDDLIFEEENKLEKLKLHKQGLLQKLFPKKDNIVPELRFPNFNGSWEKIKLNKLALYRRGSFPQPYGLPEWYDELNGVPFIQVYDVDENLKLKSKTKNKISKLAEKQSVFIPKGTLIITIQGTIGKVAITNYDAYVDRTLLLFEKFYRKINKIFIAYSLQLLFDIEKQKAPGGIIKTITKEVLSDFIINLPHNEKEQEKIADCLTTIDDLINAQNKKIKTLKLHKKGLVQGLFPSLKEVADE